MTRRILTNLFALLPFALATPAPAPAPAQILTPRETVARRSFTPNFNWAALSEDGRRFARSDGTDIQVEPAEGGPERQVGPVASDHDLHFGGMGPFALRWATGSDHLWSLRRNAAGVLEPVRLGLDGSIETFEPVPTDAPLEALMFLDGEGLILSGHKIGRGLFLGVPGRPTIAVTDLRRSKLLAILHLDTLPALAPRREVMDAISRSNRRDGGGVPESDLSGYVVQNAAARLLPDGGVRACGVYDPRL